MKIKLIDEWRRCYKFISIWCMGITGAVTGSWDVLPPEWRQILLNNTSMGILFKTISVISLMGIIGRLVKQGEKK